MLYSTIEATYPDAVPKAIIEAFSEASMHVENTFVFDLGYSKEPKHFPFFMSHIRIEPTKHLEIAVHCPS